MSLPMRHVTVGVMIWGNCCLSAAHTGVGAAASCVTVAGSEVSTEGHARVPLGAGAVEVYL